jgi:hypothetical protein
MEMVFCTWIFVSFFWVYKNDHVDLLFFQVYQRNKIRHVPDKYNCVTSVSYGIVVCGCGCTIMLEIRIYYFT